MRPVIQLSLTLVLALGLALGASVDSASADPVKTAVGAQRAVFAKSGTQLKTAANALSKTVKSLPYGTRVKVEQVQGGWLRVTEYDGSTAGAQGWLRANQTVEPFALTHGGQFGKRSSTRGSGRVTQREVAAAGRQFDETSEKAHRGSSRAALRAAYQKLDNMVEAVKPTLSEIRAFIAEGRLGRTGPRRTKPAGG